MATSGSTGPVLVTSVPIVHLEAATGLRRVAFGSRLIDVLSAFGEEAGEGADVYIHGSRDQSSDGLPETVEWIAGWLGWEQAVGNGAPPRTIARYRPPTARNETGYWYGFYVVSGLHRLEAPVPIREFSSWSSDATFSASFIPRGPVIARR